MSPAGFALVLLLFLFLPFLSVSCEAPGAGTIRANYTGVDLATRDRPDVEFPKGLEDMASQLPRSHDAGVSMLAIIVALLLVAGVASVLVPRPRVRLLAATAVAFAASTLMVVTQVIAQSNLTDLLTAAAARLNDTVPADRAGELVHTGVGFWLSVVGLAGVGLLSAGLVLRRPDLTST